LAPKTASSTLLATNSSSEQKNGFLGGAGVQYARYSTRSIGNINNFINAVRT